MLKNEDIKTINDAHNEAHKRANAYRKELQKEREERSLSAQIKD